MQCLRYKNLRTWLIAVWYLSLRGYKCQLNATSIPPPFQKHIHLQYVSWCNTVFTLKYALSYFFELNMCFLCTGFLFFYCCLCRRLSFWMCEWLCLLILFFVTGGYWTIKNEWKVAVRFKIKIEGGYGNISFSNFNF